MKIGIIVHSQSGHTLLVGEKLREKLRNGGHEVTLERFQNTEPPEGPQKLKYIRLIHIPGAARYDTPIFGAWVQAFNLCPGFHLYLKQIPDFDTSNVSCFLTEQFPYKWMGGSWALSRMKKSLEGKGAKINVSGVINWGNKKRKRQTHTRGNGIYGPKWVSTFYTIRRLRVLKHYEQECYEEIIKKENAVLQHQPLEFLIKAHSYASAPLQCKILCNSGDSGYSIGNSMSTLYN